MKKTAFLIDSTFLISDEYLKQHNIYIVPLSINFEDISYKDSRDSARISEDIFNKVEELKKIPTTSQPSAQEYLDVYNKIINDGFERIISFSLTSKLSGTFQGNVTAANMIKEENDIEIDVFDSLNVCISTLPILEIIKRVELGQDISNDEINNILVEFSKKSKVLLAVDNLEFLSLGGRIKPAIATLGNLFGIKPLLEIKEGEILEYAKVRSQKKMYQKILDDFEEDVKNNKDKTFQLVGTHVLNEKVSNKLINSMAKILEKNEVTYKVEFNMSLSPVIGNHTGPKTVGVCWVKR